MASWDYAAMYLATQAALLMAPLLPRICTGLGNMGSSRGWGGGEGNYLSANVSLNSLIHVESYSWDFYCCHGPLLYLILNHLKRKRISNSETLEAEDLLRLELDRNPNFVSKRRKEISVSRTEIVFWTIFVFSIFLFFRLSKSVSKWRSKIYESGLKPSAKLWRNSSALSSSW